VDGYGGAFGEEDAGGLLVVEVGEGGAVEGGEVGVEGGVEDGVGEPAGVFDLIGRGGGVAAFGVAPVMLGDEVFFAVGLDGLGRGRGGYGEAVGLAAAVPAVVDVEGFGREVDAVMGWDCGVGLLVEAFGDEGDGGAGDELADEDYAAFVCAVGFLAADVEAEVYFFEARVEGDGETLDADAGEEEGYQGDVALVLEEV